MIIVSVLGGNALERCRAAFTMAGECLVSERGSGSVPQRRMAAVCAAKRPIVALIEDTVTPEPDWAHEAARMLSKQGVVGCAGPVCLSPNLSARSAALALADFGRFGLRHYHRLSTGVLIDESIVSTPVLPGCNMAFRRTALLAAMDPQDGFVDQDAFSALIENGGTLAMTPTMSVTYSKDHEQATGLTNRYEHGRIYASRALEGRSPAARALAALRSLALPFVLTGRVARYRASLPVLGWALLQNGAWSLGELRGSLSTRRHQTTHWS